jgi:hypothetical protein
MKRPGLAKIHFPTALGLLILLVAIGVGIYLVRTKTVVESGAEATITPKQVQITNMADIGFTVSWITDKPINGMVQYGTEPNSLTQQALDERDSLSGEIGKYEIHYVSIKGLKQKTTYYFKLKSGNKEYDNNGKPFEVTTGPTLGVPPAADPVYGTVLTPSGTTAEGVIVYLNVAQATPLSALVKTNGNWALSLSTARTADLSSYLTYDMQATIINIRVQGGRLGTATAITTTMNDSPVPEITLGQNHDFRSTAGTKKTTTGGQADKDKTEPVSGFKLEPIATDSTEATESGEVTLENPSFEGEVLNATQPAFIGTGPPGTVLSIEINSDNVYTGSVAVDEEGGWEFSPPEGLEPGEHTITIAYIDAEGVEQTLTRSFVIAAAGESNEPAITATPSGETAASPAPRTEMPSTEAGVPKAGSFTPTAILFMMGLGFLIGGAILKKHG